MHQRLTKREVTRSITQSLQEYLRGVAGGLLFSLPLLYTMEVWWAGFIADPLRLLIYVLATFLLLLGYNRYAGLRRDSTWAEVAIDSVEEMGLGLLIAAAMLWLLGRISTEMTEGEIVGKIVIEAMTVAIGVSVGTAQLGGGGSGEGDIDEDRGLEKDNSEDDRGDDKQKSDRQNPDEQNPNEEGLSSGGNSGGGAGDKPSFGGQVVIALCGAVLFASNVAPTEEIVMIAVEDSLWKLLGLMFVSIALGAIINFYIDFTGAQKFSIADGTSDVVMGTVMTYAVALIASALILWFFGRFDGLAPVTCLAQTIVLGLPATLGASAGRFLLQ